MVINRQNIKRLKAVGLMALGLGIGSGGTLLLQQWTTDSMPVLKQGVAEQQLQEPALTTALLLQGEPVLGSSDAPVTIVEFSDFECPYRKRFHEQVLPRSNGSTSMQDSCASSTRICRCHFIARPDPRRLRPVVLANRTLLGSLQRPLRSAELSGMQGRCRIAEGLNIDSSALQACIKRNTTQRLLLPISPKPNCTTSGPPRPS